MVAEVIKRIESNAEFSFDYVCLVVVAACLAFMGETNLFVKRIFKNLIFRACGEL